MRRGLIDWSSRPPLAETSVRGAHLRNYDRIYASTRTDIAAADEDEALKRYLDAYDAVGAAHVLVKARDLETTFGVKVANEDVAAFCRRHGPRYVGFAGVDPHKGMTALREIEVAVKELGLMGLNLQCFEHKLAINDKLMYPLYAKCIELDIPVNIHCGINFSTQSMMAYGQPHLLDEVMMHFPELRVCAAPPGWPWVHELIGVAWKHPNVHIGLVYMKPKLLTVENSGYEALLQYGRTILQDKIIFGSGFPNLSLTSALAEIEALPLDDAVKDKWLYANAARLLKL
ncbi:MAG: amidohydrolase [Alphaproteobacteria bacterium]|nr:amidohydrolase [Alphaproteobacteria bacterium]